MAKPFSPIFMPALLGIAAVVILGCSISSTVAGGGTSAAATATPTLTPTATSVPTATPTPGHLLVTVHPNPAICSGSSCNPYVCHDGMTCRVDWTCLSPAWPTLTLSNTGQASLTWNGNIHGNINQPNTVGWSLSATYGSLAGGAATIVSVNENPGQIRSTDVSVVFTGAAQTVTIELSCGIG
jgi:hypothetical protein